MWHTVWILLCGATTLAIWPAGAAAQATITVEAGWSNAFGGERIGVPLVVKSDKLVEASLVWSLNFEYRVLARGEMGVKVAPGEAKRTVVPIDAPPIRDGVVLSAELTFTLIAPPGADPPATHTQPLWIFPKDPYADSRQWLEALNITLFDPSGKTAAFFEQASIPFHSVRGQGALDQIDQGMLVIGEGVSLREQSGLSESMLRAASRGLPVLCLAPSDGDLPLSDGRAEDKLQRPRSISLRQTDIVHELDKRLEAEIWQGHPAILQSLRLRGENNDAVASVIEGRTDWPWLEIHFPKHNGRLIVCGYGIVRHAQAGPAPRFLLSCLFERLVAKQSKITQRK